MLIGLAGGALWALDTVILGMALALPVFTGDPRAAILAPFASTFLHDLCSSLWMLGYTGLRRQYKAVWQALRTRGGRFVALGALLGGPVGMTGYVLAINAIGPAYTAIISALYPALGTVLAHFFLKEKLRPTGLIGLALSIGGVIALGYTPGTALPKGHLLGFGCALLCCIGWAAEGVICTYGLQSSTVTNAQALQIRQPVSALTYAIVLLPACKGWGFTAGLFGTRALWIIALSALCGTASYLCYYKALGKLGTGKAMPLNITYAAWSLPFSYLLLHQVPGTKDILCALVVLLGALLAAYEKPQKLEKIKQPMSTKKTGILKPKEVFSMPDLFHLTPEMNQYFNALPESVKENIIQSGAKINSLEDLKAVAAQLCNHAE